MSILLDALRKSEQRERLGAVPDIHDASSEPGSQGRRPWLLPALAVIAILLLLGGGYVAWRNWAQPRVPVAEPELPPLAEPEPATIEAPVEPEEATPAADTGGSEPSDVSAVRLDRQPRSPVETLSGDRPYRPAATADTSVSAPPSVQASPPTPAATTPASQTAADSAATAPATRNAQAQQAAKPRPAPAEPPQATARNDDPPGVVSFWQLPEDVRSGLPPLNINVMVYNDDPERRFIIMGGKRYREGAQVQRNLTLESVRRDRALFRHGAYLFYVKQ